MRPCEGNQNAEVALGKYELDTPGLGRILKAAINMVERLCLRPSLLKKYSLD